MPRTHEDPLPTFPQLAELMQRIENRQIGRHALTAFLQNAELFSEDNLVMSALRMQAEALYARILRGHHVSATNAFITARTVEQLKQFGFRLVYLPGEAVSKKWPWPVEPDFSTLDVPSAAARHYIAGGRWLAVETRRNDGKTVARPVDLVSEHMEFTSPTGRKGLEVEDILSERRRVKLARPMELNPSAIRLPTCEEYAFLARLFDYEGANHLERDPGMADKEGALEWCQNRYGSQPGLAMGHEHGKIKQVMPGWHSYRSRSNVSFRLVIDFADPDHALRV